MCCFYCPVPPGLVIQHMYLNHCIKERPARGAEQDTKMVFLKETRSFACSENQSCSSHFQKSSVSCGQCWQLERASSHLTSKRFTAGDLVMSQGLNAVHQKRRQTGSSIYLWSLKLGLGSGCLSSRREVSDWVVQRP